MKKAFKEIIVSIFALYFTSLIWEGLHVKGGLENYLLGGLLLTLGDYILKPFLNVITFPLKVLTFGLFSLLINSITLFIISLIYPSINVANFYFSGISYKGFVIPGFNINIFLSYFIISGTIYLIKKLVFWIFSE